MIEVLSIVLFVAGFVGGFIFMTWAMEKWRDRT